jgi:ribosome-associated toxin RatA of RatAB toxin-antitoxin module
MKRTILFAAAALFTASAVAHMTLGQGKSSTDATEANAELCRQDTAKPPCAHAPAEIKVEQNGDEFVLYAQSEVDADRATIWSTLSDYDHLNRFIPGMSSSHIVSRRGADVVVEQKGSVGFGPFRRRFTVLLAVREELNQSISASGIGGDFRYFESRYEIVPLGPQRLRIIYQATFLPDSALPPILGLSAIRFMIATQFNALLAEIQRRARTAGTDDYQRLT